MLHIVNIAASSSDKENRFLVSHDIILITEPEKVADIAAAIAARGRMVFDVEFVSEGRMIPELSLIQVAWGDDHDPDIAVLDCVALGGAGLAPIFEVLGCDDIETVAHAARQDLGLLAIRHDVTVSALHDTQIAAAFADMGDQVGYAKLVHRLLGIRLDKSQQFTAWLERPLSERQLRYAAADVRYLPAVWAVLRDQLEQRGRLHWVAEESARLARSMGPLPPPEQAFRQVMGWRALHGPALASLQALAAWRIEQAVASNRPLSWILPDRAMIELCRKGAASPRDVRSVRGVGEGIARRHGQAILAAIATGAAQSPPDVDERPKPALSPRAEIWASVITILIQARCLAAKIAPHLVDIRGDAEALASWFDRGDSTAEPGIQLLQGWRRELAGDAALAWLRGDTTISVDCAGIEGIESRGAGSPGPRH
jgi:ribonuclease D